MTMRVEVRIHFGEKNYSLNREVENHFLARKVDVRSAQHVEDKA